MVIGYWEVDTGVFAVSILYGLTIWVRFLILEFEGTRGILKSGGEIFRGGGFDAVVIGTAELVWSSGSTKDRVEVGFAVGVVVVVETVGCWVSAEICESSGSVGGRSERRSAKSLKSSSSDSSLVESVGIS